MHEIKDTTDTQKYAWNKGYYWHSKVCLK
jgi:hypothetical protein